MNIGDWTTICITVLIGIYVYLYFILPKSSFNTEVRFSHRSLEGTTFSTFWYVVLTVGINAAFASFEDVNPLMIACWVIDALLFLFMLYVIFTARWILTHSYLRIDHVGNMENYERDQLGYISEFNAAEYLWLTLVFPDAEQPWNSSRNSLIYRLIPKQLKNPYTQPHPNGGIIYDWPTQKLEIEIPRESKPYQHTTKRHIHVIKHVSPDITDVYIFLGPYSD